MNDNLQNYELMTVISVQLSEEEIIKQLDKIRPLLTEAGGSISFEDQWGVRPLAYRLEAQENGYFVVFNFQTAPEKIHALEENFRLDKNIIRHLLIKTPVSYEPKNYKDILIEEQRLKKIAEDRKGLKETQIIEKKAKKKKVSQDLLEEVVKEMPEVKKKELVDKQEMAAEEKAPHSKTTSTPILSREEEKKKLAEVEEKLDSIISNPMIKL